MEQAIHMHVINDRGQEWCLTMVCACPDEILRKQLWENMRLVAANMVMPWLVTGDFNDISYANEKRRWTRFSSQMYHFCKQYGGL